MNNERDNEKQAERIEADINKQFGKEHGFTVPQGYFNDLNKSIIEGIEQEARIKKGKIRTMRILVISAAAACAALLLTFVFNSDPVVKEHFTESPELILDEFYFEAADLEAAFEEDEVPLAAVTIELNEDEMAEYIEDNGIELEYLLEEI